MHLLCLLYITRTGNFTDLWTKVVTYGDSRLQVSEKQHCWGSNPWPSGFADTYGRSIMRFRTPNLCLGTLKGICSKGRDFTAITMPNDHLCPPHLFQLVLAPFCFFPPSWLFPHFHFHHLCIPGFSVDFWTKFVFLWALLLPTRPFPCFQIPSISILQRKGWKCYSAWTTTFSTNVVST